MAVKSNPGCVLLTGFEPFGGQPVNPSWQAVQALHGETVAGCNIVGAQVPTVFEQALPALRANLRQHRPTLVLCVGQAGGRTALSLERVAINVNDARIRDNAGDQPIDTPVIRGGPVGYFSSVPIKAMLKALLDAGVRGEVSQTAGTFVCNHVFYGLMHELAQPEWQGVRGGMVHVPWLPEQGQPSMPLAELVQGLRICVEVALTVHKDIVKQAGALN